MITLSLLFALSVQPTDWEVLELELPTEARCMAPRFSPDGVWLTWIEVAADGGWAALCRCRGAPVPPGSPHCCPCVSRASVVAAYGACTRHTACRAL